MKRWPGTWRRYSETPGAIESASVSRLLKNPKARSMGVTIIPPTELLDRSGAAYTTKAAPRLLPEYHPRQWVDSSSPAYIGAHPRFPFCPLSPLAPRGERDNQNRGCGPPLLWAAPERSTHCRGWYSRSFHTISQLVAFGTGVRRPACRPSMNNPPTQLGGLHLKNCMSSTLSSAC